MIDKIIFEYSKSERFLSFIQSLADVQKIASKHILNNNLCNKELTEKLSELNILMTHMSINGDIDLDAIKVSVDNTLEELNNNNNNNNIKSNVVEFKRTLLHLVS